MLDKSGFTMIETLFVLMIMSLLFCLSMNVHIPTKNESIRIDEIKRFLYLAKLTAMVQKEKVTVTFSSDDICYEWNNALQVLKLDEDDSFEEHQMTFNANGNIQGAKTLTFYCKEKTYNFVYQIGSGTFYVR